MSYVIQNFYFNSTLIVMTPRLRFLITLKSLNFFFVFFKLNFFFRLLNRSSFNYGNHFHFFYNYLFNKQLNKVLRDLNLKFSGNYTNNVTKAALFYSLKKVSTHFTNINYCAKTRVTWSPSLLFNLNFLSIKVANNRIKKKYYENIFFTLLLYLSQSWTPHTSLIKFDLNFFFVNYSNQMFRFYGGYFWKIYNF